MKNHNALQFNRSDEGIAALLAQLTREIPAIPGSSCRTGGALR
jgi:hypothetical protein